VAFRSFGFHCRVWSTKRDLAAVYKAAWPNIGRSMSMALACPASPSALLHGANNNLQNTPILHELLPVTEMQTVR